jgi:hypothetical protein
MLARRRATREGLREDELALFNLLQKEALDFWEKEQTKVDIEVFILDEVFSKLPTPPFTTEEKKAVAGNVYAHVWQQAMNGELAMASFAISSASTIRAPRRRPRAVATPLGIVAHRCPGIA